MPWYAIVLNIVSFNSGYHDIWSKYSQIILVKTESRKQTGIERVKDEIQKSFDVNFKNLDIKINEATNKITQNTNRFNQLLEIEFFPRGKEYPSLQCS